MTIAEPAPPSTRTSLPARMPTLDGVRGIGMVAVLVAHLSQYCGLSHGSIDNAALKILLRGGYAVVMFFVLSGFLITGILLDTKGRSNYFKRFFSRRSRRIFPLYFGFILVAMVVIPAVFPVSHYYRGQIHEQGWYWTYTVNYAAAVKGWAPFQYFGHFWTLAVEEQFYLVWPFVVLLLPRHWLKRLCLVLLAVGLGTRIATMYAHNEVATDVLLFSNLDSLGFGALLALHARSGKPFPLRLMKWVAIASPFAFASLSVWPILLPATANVMWALAPTVTLFGFGSLMIYSIYAAPTTRLHRITTWKPAIAVGTISYGIYVFHQPIIFLVVRGWHLDAGDVPSIAGSRLPGMVVVGLVSSVVIGVLAYLSHRFVEQPAQRLKLKRRVAPTTA